MASDDSSRVDSERTAVTDEMKDVREDELDEDDFDPFGIGKEEGD